MEDNFKEIINTNGYYKIDSNGNILSVRKNKILKNSFDKLGYAIINTNINGKKQQHYVHRLIAIHFIPNLLNKPNVHHKNHNKSDYRIENLEWVTQSENILYDYKDGFHIGKTNMKGLFGELNPSHKKVKQFDKEGNLLNIINGIAEAARLVNGSASHITKVCRGKLKHHKGYKWQYV